MTNNKSYVSRLSPDRMASALELRDYMLGEALRAGDANIVLSEMSERFRKAGLPLERSSSIVPLLHAENAASARFWELGKGARNTSFPYQPKSTAYARSPAADVHESGEWVVMWLPDTPDDRYGIVPELKEDGFTHYLMMPVFMVNGLAGTFSFATRSPDGFSEEDFDFFRAVFPAIAACQEILATHRIMSEVIRIYVGSEPGRRILAGDVRRGEVMRIRSAILFSDMRKFTELTADMTEERATQLLNDYYDCIVPAIEEQDGEVLKFIGDGILAIFRAEGNPHAACERAARAASDALAAVDQYGGAPQFDVGIALHFGEVAFGNVGSGVRLDYTVIGKDVNIASRLAALCGAQSEPLLVSQQFGDHVPKAPLRPVGSHDLKGLSGQHVVFALDPQT